MGRQNERAGATMRADYDLYVVLIGNSQCVSKKTDGQIDQLSRPFYEPMQIGIFQRIDLI